MSAWSGSPTGSVVVGLDDSEPARRALRWGAAAASAFGSRLVAVHAVGLLEGGGYAGSFDLDAALRDTGARAAVALREPGPPDQVLLRVAEREGAALLVVGHRGGGGSLEPLGSTTAAVVAATRVPVVVVP